MFNWLKRKKQKMLLDKHLKNLKQLILNVDISEKPTKEELDKFYSQIEAWSDILIERREHVVEVMKCFSVKDKLELFLHLDTCINNYGKAMIELSEALHTCLNNEKISNETKVEIATFGKDNLIKAEETLKKIQALAKSLTE